MVYPHTDTATHLSTNPAVHGCESSSQPVDHKSDACPKSVLCFSSIFGWIFTAEEPTAGVPSLGEIIFDWSRSFEEAERKETI